MLTLFGRKRRSVKKTVKKPAKRLLAICKKYGIKTTLKRGTKRVYKSTTVLRKLCMKKNRTAFGECKRQMVSFGMHKGVEHRAMTIPTKHVLKESKFGAHRKTSKAAAMRAFRTFYKRHNARRFGFGNGGNPALSQTMGSEFCNDGTGVLGPGSTGLFPSPCGAFGKRRRTVVRRRRSAAAFGKRRVVRRRRSTRSSFGRKRRVGRPRKVSRSTRKVGGRKRRVTRASFGRKRRVGRPRKVSRSTRKVGDRKRRVVHRKRRVVSRRRNLFGF